MLIFIWYNILLYLDPQMNKASLNYYHFIILSKVFFKLKESSVYNCDFKEYCHLISLLSLAAKILEAILSCRLPMLLLSTTHTMSSNFINWENVWLILITNWYFNYTFIKSERSYFIGCGKGLWYDIVQLFGTGFVPPGFGHFVAPTGFSFFFFKLIELWWNILIPQPEWNLNGAAAL